MECAGFLSCRARPFNDAGMPLPAHQGRIRLLYNIYVRFFALRGKILCSAVQNSTAVTRKSPKIRRICIGILDKCAKNCYTTCNKGVVGAYALQNQHSGVWFLILH